MPPTLHTRVHDRVATLTLSYPEKRNALHPTQLAALCDELSRLPAQGVGAVVLTSEGSTFSSGHDITALPDQPDADWLTHHGNLGRASHLLATGSLPIVAALPGPAIGAGLELALHCDLRLGTPHASLCLPPVRLGILYHPQGIARLAALCGFAMARRLLLLSETLDAHAARQAGLLDEIIPGDAAALTARAHTLATQLAAQPPLALLGTRRMLECLLARLADLPDAQAAELLALRQAAWHSPAAQAIRSAFRAPKSPPR